MCVAILEISGDGQRERENGKREARSQIILVGKEGVGSKRIEALLVGQIEHVGKRVEYPLEDGRTVKVGGGVETIAASGITGNCTRGNETAGAGSATCAE